MFKTATKLITLALAILATTQNIASGKSHSTPENGVWEKIYPSPVHVRQSAPQVQNHIGFTASADEKPPQVISFGQWIAVEEVVETGEWEVVYNLRIADYHTYFVTDWDWGFSVWSHNICEITTLHTYSTGRMVRVRDGRYEAQYFVPSGVTDEVVEATVARDKRSGLGNQLATRAQALSSGWASQTTAVRYGAFLATITMRLAHVNSLRAASGATQVLTLDGVDQGAPPPITPNPVAGLGLAWEDFYTLRAIAKGIYIHNTLRDEFQTTQIHYYPRGEVDFCDTRGQTDVWYEVLKNTPDEITRHTTGPNLSRRLWRAIFYV